MFIRNRSLMRSIDAKKRVFPPPPTEGKVIVKLKVLIGIIPIVLILIRDAHQLPFLATVFAFIIKVSCFLAKLFASLSIVIWQPRFRI